MSKPGFSLAPIRSITVDMEGERHGGALYSLLLLAGLGGLIGLGLIGLPVASAILLAFGAVAVAIVVWGVCGILAA